MTNTKLLRSIIDKKGLKMKYVAERMGLSAYGFQLKVENKKEFKTSEVTALCDILEIESLEQKEKIFFAKIDDLKSGKKFEHPVVRSNYPVDVHSDKKDGSTLDIVQDYELPIESLMSADIDNLYVAGRCLSADYMAQGALRVQASCFSMGEAVAKHIKSNLS